MTPSTTLRPARPEDEPFLFALYRDVRAGETLGWEWSEEQREAFLTMQHRARDAHRAAYFAGAEDQIVTRDEQPIGRILVRRASDEIHLVDIAILSAHRGAGIGTRLIRDLQSEAAQAGVPVRLRVSEGHRAIRLYQRLGFSRLQSLGTHLLMEWRPPARSRG